MAYRFREGFAIVVLVAWVVGCASQSKQSSHLRTGQSPADQFAQRECLGSACGNAIRASRWTLESGQSIPAGWALHASFGCFGSVCGPDATGPSWILELNNEECFGSVCGQRTIALNSVVSPSRVAMSQRPTQKVP